MSVPWFIIILNILELVASATGFVYWSKIRSSYWKYFPAYLGLLFVTEMAGEYFLFVRNEQNISISIYRFFGIPLEFLFLFWLFYQHFCKSAIKALPLVFAIIYAVAYPVDLLVVGKMKLPFDSFSYCLGSVFLLILLLLFFLRLSRSDEMLGFKTSIMFWVCTGLMIFYLGTLPFYGLRSTLYYHYRHLFQVLWYIQYALNYVMYLLFTVAFIWGKPK